MLTPVEKYVPEEAWRVDGIRQSVSRWPTRNSLVPRWLEMRVSRSAHETAGTSILIIGSAGQTAARMA